MNAPRPPLRATRLGPTEAEEAAALVAFEQLAHSRGIVLMGHKDAFGPGYHVFAARADTGARLLPRFAVTPEMAHHPATFTAALETLLAEAEAVLAKAGGGYLAP